jgi:hypothetical protein
MGQHFQFRCASCAYEVEVSGGPDCGFAVATQTIACSKCKKLYDVVTSKDPGNPDAPAVPLRCPRSRGAAHRVTAWNGGDPCPRCSETMVATGESLALWD